MLCRIGKSVYTDCVYKKLRSVYIQLDVTEKTIIYQEIINNHLLAYRQSALVERTRRRFWPATKSCHRIRTRNQRLAANPILSRSTVLTDQIKRRMPILRPQPTQRAATAAAGRTFWTGSHKPYRIWRRSLAVPACTPVYKPHRSCQSCLFPFFNSFKFQRRLSAPEIVDIALFLERCTLIWINFGHLPRQIFGSNTGDPTVRRLRPRPDSASRNCQAVRRCDQLDKTSMKLFAIMPASPRIKR